MKLKVMGLPIEDTWKDIVRIDKHHRKDSKGKHIKRGSICRLCLGDKSKWVVVHGRKTQESVIQMDLNVRLQLDVSEGEEYEFTLHKMSWLRSLWFPWKASDPIFRVPAQLALISLFLGVVLGIGGILVGFVPIYNDYKKEHAQHRVSNSVDTSGKDSVRAH